MNGNSKFFLGFLSAVTGAALWGFSGSCAQYLTQHCGVHPIFLTAFRSSIAILFFFLAMTWRRRKVVRAGKVFVGPFHTIFKNKRTIRGFFLFSVSLGVDQFAYSAAVAYTNAGTATVLQMLSAVIVMVITCFILKKLPATREVSALFLAIIATVVISTQGDLGSVVLPALGLFWGILNAFACAGYIMFPKYTGLFDAIGSFASVACGTLICAIGGWIVLACLQMTGIDCLGAVSNLEVQDWLIAVFGLAFTGTFLAFALYVRGVSMVGPVVGSLLGAVEPVSAAVLSFLWLGTDFTMWDSCGLVLMVIMLVLTSVKKQNSSC